MGVCVLFVFFCFCKQKTAYEMRISDWSSDVCSSDLVGFGAVWVFSPRGEPQYRIDSPEGLYTTNCAYGGPDGRTLHMIESRTGCVFTARLPVGGKTMYSHASA